jgi:Flp pilus assembly protein CpaB
LLPAGARGFSLAVSQVASAGGLVRPGDYVDILSSSSQATADSGATAKVSSCYVLQDVQVLVVGATLANPKSQTNAGALAATLPDPAASVMTVAVSPRDAGVLAAAQQSPGSGSVGQPVWVALRPFGEHGAAAGNLPTCA